MTNSEVAYFGTDIMRVCKTKKMGSYFFKIVLKNNFFSVILIFKNYN